MGAARLGLKKLAIITTHPIQYNAPLFRMLHERGKIKLKVFYTWGDAVLVDKYDPGFGKTIQWDIPLLDGYDYCFVNNIASKAGSHHFNGIVNPGLINDLTEWKPDALLVFGWSFKSHLKLLRHFKGKIKIIFRGDSNLLDETPGLSIKKLFRRTFLRWIYHHVDHALYVGSANKEYFLQHGLKKEQLVFAPHAIDNDRFGQEGRESYREELGIAEKEIMFLFAGKLEPKKNPFLLLHNFAMLKQSSAYLLIVGNGVLENELKTEVAAMPEVIKSRIRFLPFQNQQSMPAIYKTADLLVVPSQGPGETWGLSVNEAMAAGVAVLVSNKCGCADDLVSNGVTGYIFKWNMENDFREKMNLLASDKQELRVMGLNGRKAIQHWSFKNACIAIEELV